MDNALNPSHRSLRVLVLDEELPWPLDAGKRIRTWHLLTDLAQRHQVTIVAYGGANSEAARAVTGAGIQFVPVAPRRLETGPWLYGRIAAGLLSREPFSVTKHYRRRFRNAVADLLAGGNFDLIHCEWTPYAQFVPRAARNVPPVVIATHNIEADILSRRAETRSRRLARTFFAGQAARMQRFERRAFARADHVTTVSVQDQQRAMEWGARRTSVVANGVATDEFVPVASGAAGGNELLFLGSLDWFANVDAVTWFVAEILPLIRQSNPAAHLSVVGRRPGEDVRRVLASAEGATLVGEVDDVRPFVQRAAALVVPLRIGGGTRIKILEAMAAGKIVVSTTVGAEGLDVVSGEDVLLADTPRDFAAAALRALDPQQLQEIPMLARALVEEKYSWRLQAQRLEQAWLATAAARSTR